MEPQGPHHSVCIVEAGLFLDAIERGKRSVWKIAIVV
jgi:hypothetical protein